MTRTAVSRVLIPITAVLTLLPATSAAMALVAGGVIAFFLGNVYPTKNYTHRLLTWSVVGLGAGMNLHDVLAAGARGIGYAALSIACVLIMGTCLRRLLKVDPDTGLLMTFGTAICGGSAIAALTPVIRAKPHAVSVALGAVFLLNALALVTFPWIGHALGMSERAFGLWSALAIHDTSSVVGATVSYGPIAAQVGTTVKLARALWIVPLVVLIGLFRKNRAETSASKPRRPWFILGFLLAAALVTWVPVLQPAGNVVAALSKRALVLTIFFIGLGFSRDALREVGARPFFLAVLLWVLTSTLSLGAVLYGWID